MVKPSALFTFLVLFVLALSGCGPKGGPSATPERPTILATTGMIGDLAKIIAGPDADVTVMMGAGVDPHLYRPTPEDTANINKASAILYNGLHLEGRMTEILEKLEENGQKPVVAVTETLPQALLISLPGGGNQVDPHVWFDVTLWRQAALVINDTLTRLVPAKEANFEERTTKLLKELDALDVWVKEQLLLVPKERRVLITAHDAFAYFGKRYGVEVMGIQGTSTAAEASAKTIQTLAETISTRKIPAIFVESSVPKATIEALQQAVGARGWQVKIGGQLYSDALGNQGTPEGTYQGMFRANVNTIVKALR